MSEVKTNKISSLDSSNSDITLDPDGTGDVVVASGNLGIGEASPATPLHISTGSSTTAELRLTSNNTGSGSGDRGRIAVYSSRNDGTAYEAGRIEIDRSSGTEDTAHILFATNNGSGVAEKARIDSSGHVMINQTSSPVSGPYYLSVYSADSVNAAFEAAGTSSHTQVRFINGNGIVGTIVTNGSGTSFNTSSDHRLKEAVVDMTGAITRVKALAPKRFNFIADDSVTVDGFMAHEAQTVVPEAVTGEHNEVDADGNAVMQGIDQSKLVPLLTGALQEAIAKIETLETKVAALEAGE